MQIDYFYISQLRVHDLYAYLTQFKNKNVHKVKKESYLLRILGFEFFILLVTVVIYSLILSPYILLTGGFVVFSYLVYDLLLAARLSKVGEKIKLLRENRVKVIRDGKVIVLPEDRVEVGDIVVVSKGEKVLFDLRVIESNNLIVDESKVFGEPKLSHKSAVTLSKKDFKIYELTNIIFINSLVVQGSGKGIVINKVSHSQRSLQLPIKVIYHPLHTVGVTLVSLLIGFMNFILTKDVASSILLLILAIFLLSQRHVFKLKFSLWLDFTEEILENGIVPPSPLKLENWLPKSIVIKLDPLSFGTQKPKYFIPRKQKTISQSDLICVSEEIEEMVMWFLGLYVIYSKTKNLRVKMKIAPIIDNLTSLGISKDTAKDYKIVEVDVSSSLDTMSTIKFKNKEEMILGVISLNSFLEKFGSVIGLDLSSRDGIVILVSRLPYLQSFEPMVVIIFDNYGLKPQEINFLSQKTYFLSELSYKELKNYFEVLGIDISSLSSLDIDDFVKSREEQKKFYTEKFQLFFNLNLEKQAELVKYFETEESLDCFIEVSNKRKGLMKIPYFGYTYSRNNLILSTTSSILIPFVFLKKLEDYEVKEKNLLRVNLFFLMFSFFVMVLMFLLGVPAFVNIVFVGVTFLVSLFRNFKNISFRKR